jgi:hypothetical protein
MSHTSEPTLIPTPIADLRPTQITVGLREVEQKRAKWRKEGPKKQSFLGAHMIPVVIGPKNERYILDHHHLALALHLEGVERVLTSVSADLSKLPKDAFWYLLAHKNWMHVYDAKGQLKIHKDIPRSLNGLTDDPFRSLAGFLRGKGGYAKDTTLYSEFLWADFLRRNVPRKLVDQDFDKALRKALQLSQSKKADYLPGWCGPSS